MNDNSDMTSLAFQRTIVKMTIIVVGLMLSVCMLVSFIDDYMLFKRLSQVSVSVDNKNINIQNISNNKVRNIQLMCDVIFGDGEKVNAVKTLTSVIHPHISALVNLHSLSVPYQRFAGSIQYLDMITSNQMTIHTYDTYRTEYYPLPHKKIDNVQCKVKDLEHF